MQIDYTISLGTIVEISTMIAGGLIALGTLKRAVADMKERIVDVETQIKDFAKSLITLAVQSSRLDRMEEDIRDMRRGRGYIEATKPDG